MALNAAIFSSRSVTNSALPTAVADLYCSVKLPSLGPTVGAHLVTADRNTVHNGNRTFFRLCEPTTGVIRKESRLAWSCLLLRMAPYPTPPMRRWHPSLYLLFSYITKHIKSGGKGTKKIPNDVLSFWDLMFFLNTFFTFFLFLGHIHREQSEKWLTTRK